MSPQYTPRQHEISQDTHVVSAPFILPFTAIDATMLPFVGGKAANLGQLVKASLPVPQGFCITTAAYLRVSGDANLDDTLSRLAATASGESEVLEACAAAMRAALLATPIPADIIRDITAAYELLGKGESIAVAVRSSANAEDLPFASFAGQQDTYLNVVGIDAVLTAVKHCWASLWTNRAVSYRASNGIDHRTVRLAVVVQRMVEAQVAGVLFTANPLTGRRRQAVINASPGLGEAVVSGAVNPDQFVINVDTGEIIERCLGDKQFMLQATSGGGLRRVELTEQGPCLTDAQIADLARLGTQVETYYGAPQDIEWAIDATNQLWLTQARPITTLFPLPDSVPSANEALRVYLCFNVLQGVYRPFTPMGFAAMRLMASSIARHIGFPPRDARVGPSAIQEAGHRFFIDMTPLLCHPLGRKVLKRVMGRLEARSGEILQQQSADPRLTSFNHISRGTIVRRSLSILFRARAFFYIGQVLFQPEKAKKRVLGLKEQLKKQSEVRPETSASQRLTAAEALLLQNTAATICNSLFTALPAFLLTVLAGKLLGDLATPEERQVVLRALPHNPTTEMDLALWDLAQQLRADTSTAQFFLNTSHAQLVQQYHDQTLPSVLQRGLRAFLDDYGHRGVAEIDLGLPRWSEDPTYILGVLASYLQLDRFDAAPDLVFQRCAEEAEAMVTELVRRAATRGWVRSKLVGFGLRRGRALAGMREIAKFYLVLLLAGARRLLLSVADELVSTGCLEAPEDIFFVDLAEVRLALNGTSLRSVVQERRSSYAFELRRRHIPRILLSDGTEPEAALLNARGGGEDGQTLKGIPASAGKITAKARVVLDPADAHLEPGEILIAPSTDPGWTPLFLTAAGMVMEMGGPMSHGAVVAREYGIPAVVGVPGATRNIRTGQQITVDGSAGTILLVEEAA